MRSLDTIETLETFVVLARLGSVGKTAEQLHISKASVSRRISALEKSVGKLFVRDQDGSELTPHGCVFLEKIQPLLERFNKLSAPVSRPEGSICSQRDRKWFVNSLDYCIPKEKSRTRRQSDIDSRACPHHSS